jgi:hypothetical protein
MENFTAVMLTIVFLFILAVYDDNNNNTPQY